ncbi:MAG TPA: PqqD family protein [Marinilabiliaceae bacterium]|nr:PqqD family protein [Marinilabiliaceae bacterium]
MVQNPEAIYIVRDRNVVIRKVGDEMVIVPLVNSVADMTRVLTLNETGTAIIEALNGQNTINQVEEQLLQQFDVERNVLSNDLQVFIDQALDKQIIEKLA